MTGRMHDLCAFTAINVIVATQPLPQMTIGTAFVAMVGALIGGIIPDLDQHTSDAWDRFPGVSILSKVITPAIGGHRGLSHSFLGLAISGFLSFQLIKFLSTFMQIEVFIVWAAVMIGQLSHLVADTFTRDGVPWLLPVKTRIGFPPFKFLRMKTGGFVESGLLYPALLMFNGYLVFSYYEVYRGLFRTLGN